MKRMLLALALLAPLAASCESNEHIEARERLERAITALEADPGSIAATGELTRSLRHYLDVEESATSHWLDTTLQVIGSVVLAFVGVNAARNRSIPGTRRRSRPAS